VLFKDAVSYKVYTANVLDQGFPNFLHFHTPWQLISINCTPHFSKMFVINIVAVTSNLSFLTLLNYVPFSAIIQFFSRTPKCTASYHCGYVYSRLGITVLDE
jgi:hypothetical protein